MKYDMISSICKLYINVSSNLSRGTTIRPTTRDIWDPLRHEPANISLLPRVPGSSSARDLLCCHHKEMSFTAIDGLAENGSAPVVGHAAGNPASAIPNSSEIKHSIFHPDHKRPAEATKPQLPADHWSTLLPASIPAQVNSLVTVKLDEEGDLHSYQLILCRPAGDNNAAPSGGCPSAVTSPQAAGSGRVTKTPRARTHEQQRAAYAAKHALQPVPPNCAGGGLCQHRCATSFSDEERRVINADVCGLSFEARRQWFRGTVIAKPVVRPRRGTQNSRRHCTREYRLPKAGTVGTTNVRVCKQFYLSTMGFKEGNDNMIATALEGGILGRQDMRGKHMSRNKKDRAEIIEHILSFEPVTPHLLDLQKRTQLSSELSASAMYKKFMEVKPGFCSYETYRKTVVSLNISFGNIRKPRVDVNVDGF